MRGLASETRGAILAAAGMLDSKGHSWNPVAERADTI
jgi:hypothetical protein